MTDPILAKKTDENFVQYTVKDVRDADNGYCVYFDDEESLRVVDPTDKTGRRKVVLTYWLPKTYNFVPKPGDTARFYGKLGLANTGVYGLDFVREEENEDTGKGRRTRYEMFYDPNLMKSEEKTAAPGPVDNAGNAKDDEIAALKAKIASLEDKQSKRKAPKKNAGAAI